MGARVLVTMAILAAVLMPQQGRAIEPQPMVTSGDGWQTWMVPKDAKLWRLEALLQDLRRDEKKPFRDMDSEAAGIQTPSQREKVLRQLGIQPVRIGRSLHMPKIQSPIKVVTRRLGFEWRKQAILTMPVYGRHKWITVLFQQDSNDQRYWRPYQVFYFDTHAERGFNVDFPYILGDEILPDDIHFMAVRHSNKNDPKGRQQVLTLFKSDEKRMREVFQETDFHWMAGKFAGNPTWHSHKLVFGNQRIDRTITERQYLYMEAEEWEEYEGLDPYRTVTGKERFSWNPMSFSFYHAQDELEKLRDNKMPFIRRHAARRLGLILKNSHEILEKAMQDDKDAYVRMQAALAIESIGDINALPAVEKH